MFGLFCTSSHKFIDSFGGGDSSSPPLCHPPTAQQEKPRPPSPPPRQLLSPLLTALFHLTSASSDHLLISSLFCARAFFRPLSSLAFNWATSFLSFLCFSFFFLLTFRRCEHTPASRAELAVAPDVTFKRTNFFPRLALSLSILSPFYSFVTVVLFRLESNSPNCATKHNLTHCGGLDPKKNEKKMDVCASHLICVSTLCLATQ